MPHKLGFTRKPLVLSGVSGFVYNFRIYAGTVSLYVNTGEPD